MQKTFSVYIKITDGNDNKKWRENEHVNNIIMIRVKQKT